jgi:hypothetical protein
MLRTAHQNPAHLFPFTTASIAYRHRPSLPGKNCYMRIGSGQFVGLLVLVAFGAAAGGLALDSRPLLWSAVVVGAYAIHLMAVHETARTAEKGSPRAERSTLDQEREEVELLRRELERKLAHAEEQWTLLRSMVQERLRRSGASTPPTPKPGIELEPHAGQESTSDRTTKPAPELDESGRAYSRW